MGREATVRATVGAESAETRALLESDALILRGTLRRRFPRVAMTDVTVDGDRLRFACPARR